MGRVKWCSRGDGKRVFGVGGLAMDVVNGKIVDTGVATGTEAKGSEGEKRVMAEQQQRPPPASRGGKYTSGLGFVADTRTPQPSAGSFVQWAPTWAAPVVGASPSPMFHGAAVPSTLWNPRAPERGGRVAHNFTGLPDQHRQSWKGLDLWTGADQESSRIVDLVGDQGSQALRLKPSRARTVDDERASSPRDQLPGSFARAAAAEWMPTWAAAPSLLAVDPGGCSEADCGSPQANQRQGWKWSTSPTRSNAGLSNPRWGSAGSQRLYRFDASPCSEGQLDKEISLFESQLTRTISGHYSGHTSVPPSRSPDISEASALVVSDTGDDAASSAEKKSEDLVTTTSSTLKRKRSGISDGDTQAEMGWTQPLKVLVRKGLTVSDVGELGRIIVPKKDAESPSFPQIDTKEGAVLEMEDFTASKRWYFRFKYWINNKSRMYVLENTGDFIKFHCLKEHDIFVIYEDICKKLIVCGLKKKDGGNLDNVLERCKTTTSETPPTTTSTAEDESSLLQHQHR